MQLAFKVLNIFRMTCHQNQRNIGFIHLYTRYVNFFSEVEDIKIKNA